MCWPPSPPEMPRATDGSPGTAGTLSVMRRWLAGVGVTVAMVLAATGCGGGSSSSGAKSTTTQNTDPSVTAKPAGATPSESAQMICATEAQRDIAESLGVTPTRVTTPTWVDHVYSCTYEYPNGSFTMSVKEMDNLAQTKAYFDELGTKLGRQPGSIALGQGAFATTNGSMVVRKDFKVLLVDISKLPDQFGQPPQKRSDVALSAAAVLMSCWTGA
jgi:hypothetical protein